MGLRGNAVYPQQIHWAVVMKDKRAIVQNGETRRKNRKTRKIKKQKKRTEKTTFPLARSE